MSENQGPPPKQSNQSLLDTPSPKATRYRRNVIILLVTGTAMFLSAALIYGLFNGPRVAKVAVQPTVQGNLPSFGEFPNSYADTTKLAPAPLTPKNLPDAVNQGGQGGATTVGQNQGGSSGQAQQSPAEIAANKALTSDIFFQGTKDPDASNGTSGTTLASLTAPSSTVPLETPEGPQTAPSGADSDTGGQGAKNSFIASNQSPTSDYTGTAIQSPVSKYEVQAGTIIPAALLTVINSDLPGDVTAQVSENVYDTATGNYLLIPQGSRLYGKYDSLVSYAQTRALVVWNRIIYPNGKSIDLDGMIGTDPTGQSGIKDQVNTHFWGLAGALAASTILSFGPSIALDTTQGGSGNTNIYTNPASGLGSNVNNIGQEIVSKELNRPNTITIRAGWPLRVLINKDMILTPYTP